MCTYLSICLSTYLRFSLSVHLSVHLSLHPSIHPSSQSSIHLCISLSLSLFLSIHKLSSLYVSFSMSTFLSFYLWIWWSIFLTTYLAVYLATCSLSSCVSVDLSTCPPVYLSTCLSVYLSIYVSIYVSIYLCIVIALWKYMLQRCHQCWNLPGPKRSKSARCPQDFKGGRINCKISSSFKIAKVKHQEVVRGFLQKWKVKADKRSFAAKLSAGFVIESWRTTLFWRTPTPADGQVAGLLHITLGPESLVHQFNSHFSLNGHNMSVWQLGWNWIQITTNTTLVWQPLNHDSVERQMKHSTLFFMICWKGLI